MTRLIQKAVACCLLLGAGLVPIAAVQARGPAGRPIEVPTRPHLESRPPAVEEGPKQEWKGVVSDQAFRDHDLSGWKLTARSRDPRKIRYFRELLKVPAPGGRPEVALFLDNITFRQPISDIKTAWRSNIGELPGSEALLDVFFSQKAGKTVIVISHVEDNYFVIRDANGKKTLEIPIQLVLDKAQANKVLLIPLGCNTAGGGAPIGFDRNISTEQVVTFLRDLGWSPRIVDILGSMTKIGSLTIDIPDAIQSLQKILYPAQINVTIHNSSGKEITDIQFDADTVRPSAGSLSDGSYSKSQEQAPMFPQAPTFLIVLMSATGLVWLGVYTTKQLSDWTWFTARRERIKWLLLLQTSHKVLRFLGKSGLVICSVLVAIFCLHSVLLYY